MLLVIDQWPEWAFEMKRDALTAGFGRLLTEGEWHVGQHPSAATLTAAGHALLTSGEPPWRSGILANEWWHRDVERVLKAVEAEDGTVSAKWLRVPGLSDAVATANKGGKSVSVALKDRAAVLVLGHAGTPIWYEPKRAAFVSTAAVGWLDAWNAAHPIADRMREPWTPLPEVEHLAKDGDAAPGEVGMMGFGPTFPHAFDQTKDPAHAVFASPLGNELALDVATAAIDGEKLGADATPDYLAISLSAHDYIGHGWGQESWEMWDAELKLDRRLGQFLADLDTKVGIGKWSMIVTSDHGASPMPESLHGGRITFDQIKDAANKAAIAELGPGEWVANAKYPTVYLTKAALMQKPADLAIVIKKIVYALRSFPGLARVEKSSDFWGHCDKRTGDAQLICATLDPERSGEVIYIPGPGWVLSESDEPVATAHGSLQPYDRLVPVLMLPPERKPHPPLARPDSILVQMTRISTVLARWLGVTPPVEMPRPPPEAP